MTTHLDDSKPPYDASALAAAYQVAARSFSNQNQIIVRVLNLFVTFNALIVAVLQFVQSLHDAVRIVLPIIGIISSVCWYFSMKRLWIYHDTFIRVMREQEAALRLGALGVFSRTYKICEGGHGETIAGDHTKFSRTMRLRHLFSGIVVAFGTTYLVFLIAALMRVTFRAD